MEVFSYYENKLKEMVHTLEEKYRGRRISNVEPPIPAPKKKIVRVYVAGPYSADNVLEMLGNMRRGIHKGYRLFQLHYAPFVPWLDYQLSLVDDSVEQLTIQDYYNYSMAWLEVSDAVLVLPNYEHSKGTLAEIARAEELGIPVFYSIAKLVSNT